MQKIYKTVSHSSLEWIAPIPGRRYFASVVAYNKALEPSKVVCSDGITIDITPPQVTSIDIKGARIKPGFMKDTSSEEVWFVDSGRKRCKMNPDKVSTDCL